MRSVNQYPQMSQMQQRSWMSRAGESLESRSKPPHKPGLKSGVSECRGGGFKHAFIDSTLVLA